MRSVEIYAAKDFWYFLQVVEDDKGKPHIILTAIKTIYRGKELLYDYGDRSKVNFKFEFLYIKNYIYINY